MKKQAGLGLVTVCIVGAVGFGCGGGQPLEAFKGATFRIDVGQGSVQQNPPPADHYLAFVSLLPSASQPCSTLVDGTTATLNGEPGAISVGDCAKANAVPLATFEFVAQGDETRNAVFVWTDGKHRMEVEVQDLLAQYRLEARKAGFSASANPGPDVNPVAHGEVLVFDRKPALAPAQVSTASIEEEREAGNPQYPTLVTNTYEANATADGAQVSFTVPNQPPSGPATLTLRVIENHAALRCEGVAQCYTQVGMSLESVPVTVSP